MVMRNQGESGGAITCMLCGMCVFLRSIWNFNCKNYKFQQQHKYSVRIFVLLRSYLISKRIAGYAVQSTYVCVLLKNKQAPACRFGTQIVDFEALGRPDTSQLADRCNAFYVDSSQWCQVRIMNWQFVWRRQSTEIKMPCWYLALSCHSVKAIPYFLDMILVPQMKLQVFIIRSFVQKENDGWKWLLTSRQTLKHHLQF